MSNEKKKNMRLQKDRNIEKVLMGGGKKYRTLLKESNVGIYKVTPGDKGKFIDVNPAIVNILGYRSKKEVFELNVSDIYINPSDRKKLSKKMSENGFVKNEELHLKKKDGTPIIAYNTGIAVCDKNGEVLYFEGILEDVTERKKIEEALRESEEIYRTLIDTSPDSITMIDLKGNFLMVNKVTLEMHGYSIKDELIGKNVFNLVAPKDREKAKNDFKKLIKTGGFKEAVYTALKKDGTLFSLEVSVSLMKNTEGNPKAIISIARDITERKKSEMEIKQKAEDLSLLNLLNKAVNRGDSLSDIITVMTKETMSTFPVYGTTILLIDKDKKNLIMQNIALPPKLIEKIEKIIGMKVPEVKIPFDGKTEYSKILEWGKTVIISDEKTILKHIADHTDNPVLKKLAPALLKVLNIKNVIVVPIISEGTPYGIIDIASTKTFSESDIERIEFLAAHFLTILKRKIIDDALKESEEQYRKLIETSPDPILITDLDANIMMANRQAVEVYGCKKKEELIGKNAFNIIARHDRKRALKNYKKILKSGTVKNVEYTLLKNDGTAFIAEMSTSLLKDSEGNPKAIIGIVRDITFRKRVEKALIESEELYRKLIDTSPYSITINDMNGKIVMVNQGSVEMHGCKRKEDLIGKNAFDFIEPESREKLMKNMKKMIEAGGEKLNEYTLRDMNGNYFPVEVSSSILTDKDGVPKAMMAIGRDISERKRFEKAIKESEEQYRMLIETSPDSITLSDMDGRMVMANQAAIDMRGYSSEEELLRKNMMELIAPQDIEKAKKGIKETLEKGRVKNIEYTLLKKDGTSFFADICVSIIKDAEGNPNLFMAVVRDISERKKMEKALAAEKERLSVTLRSIAESVISVDIKGNVVFMNEVAEQLTGWTQAGAIGKPLCDVLNVVDSKNKPIACHEIVNDVIKKGDISCTITIDEGILIAKDETEKIIDQSCAPIRDKDNNILGVVIILRDITDKQKLEKELFKATKLESIGLLAGGIAHDFNNILTGITSSLFMAKMSLDKDSTIYKFINEAEKAAFRATKLTNQLITFAKGGAPIKESQSIREIIEEAVGFSLSGSNIDCELKLPENLWAIEIDRGQIDQVITNLIINAEQAMPEGGTITLNAENIVIGDSIPKDTTAFLPLNPGNYIKISVKDEGSGIRPEDLESIYDPYFTTKDNGSGLGLTICYSIIRKHNGFIYAKSRMGVGTTFHVFLPVSGKKAKKIEQKEEETPLTGTGKILVMDDEEVVRITAGQILKSLGYKVDYAKDGSDAIRVYKKAMETEPFDVVIMDLTVPGGMGGMEAIEKLIEIDPDVKAIVTSGYSHDPIMANFKEHGFSGVITKPYMVEEFNAVIRRVISKKK